MNFWQDINVDVRGFSTKRLTADDGSLPLSSDIAGVRNPLWLSPRRYPRWAPLRSQDDFQTQNVAFGKT